MACGTNVVDNRLHAFLTIDERKSGLYIGVVLKVTLDTNVCSGVYAPDQYFKTPFSKAFKALRQAIAEKRISVFISEGSLALEALPANERINVLFQKKASSKPSPDPRTVAKYQWFFDQDVKVLHVPRLGLISLIEVPEINFVRSSHKTICRHEKLVSFFGDYGFSELKKLGELLANSHGIPPSAQPRWVYGIVAEYDAPLEFNNQAALTRRVRDLIAEWCDLDIVASCYAYEIPYLCSCDEARSAGSSSVFHCSKRNILKNKFGVRVISPSDLVRLIPPT